MSKEASLETVILAHKEIVKQTTSEQQAVGFMSCNEYHAGLTAMTKWGSMSVL